MSKDQTIAAIKKYVHAMKNLDIGLNGEFLLLLAVVSCSFCYFLFQVILLVPLKPLIMVSVLQFLCQAV